MRLRAVYRRAIDLVQRVRTGVSAKVRGEVDPFVDRMGEWLEGAEKVYVGVQRLLLQCKRVFEAAALRCCAVDTISSTTPPLHEFAPLLQSNDWRGATAHRRGGL